MLQVVKSRRSMLQVVQRPLTGSRCKDTGLTAVQLVWSPYCRQTGMLCQVHMCKKGPLCREAVLRCRASCQKLRPLQAKGKSPVGSRCQTCPFKANTEA